MAAKKTARKRALGLKASASSRSSAASKRADYQAAFDALRKILARYEKHLVVVHDRPDSYYLNTNTVNPKNKKPVFFGAVTAKSYVAFHFMPIYVFPELVDGISPELSRRMQGKSCFNFTSVEPAVLAELKQLAARGFDVFAPQFIPAPAPPAAP